MALPKNKCQQCGYEWVARVEHPRMCPNPKCLSRDWDQPKEPVEKEAGDGK